MARQSRALPSMSGLSTGPINESSLDRHVGDAKGRCIQMKGIRNTWAGAGSQRETFGAALRRYLTERDVTPSQLAQRTDYGKSHLPSRLECACVLAAACHECDRRHTHGEQRQDSPATVLSVVPHITLHLPSARRPSSAGSRALDGNPLHNRVSRCSLRPSGLSELPR